MNNHMDAGCEYIKDSEDRIVSGQRIVIKVESNSMEVDSNKATMATGLDHMDANSSKATMATELIAKQADKIYRQRKQSTRWDTHFYKLVLGGNVDEVTRVVDYMNENGMTDTLDWLLKKETAQNRSSCSCSPARLFLIRIYMFLCLLFVTVVITPVFYMAHILSVSLLNRTQRRISKRSNLPLALAVFSRSREMIEYFISIGVDIQQTDDEGNNVFHYIADLSATSREKANDMLDTSIEIFANFVPLDTIKRMLVDDRNSAALTVLEYSTKYGSLAFLTKLLKMPNILQETEIAVAKQDVSLASNGASIVPHVNTKLELVDVTKYEAGSLADQSTLLNLVSDTDIVGMTEDDLELFSKSSFVKDWISLKLKQMWPGIIVFQSIDIIVTVCVLLLLVTGSFNFNINPWVSKNELPVYLTELKAFSENKSNVFKENNFQRLISDMQFKEQVTYLAEVCVNESVCDSIVDLVREQNPKVNRYFNTVDTNWDIGDLKTPKWVTEEFYRVATEMNNRTEYSDNFYILRYLHAILIDYTKHLFAEHSDYLQQTITLSNVEEINDTIEEYYESFTINGYLLEGWQNYTLAPSSLLKYEEARSYICILSGDFNESDLQPSSVKYPSASYYYDSCRLKFLHNMASSACKKANVKTQTLYEKYATETELNDESVDYVNYALFVLASFYLFFDLLERIVFLYTCVIHPTTASAMLTTACGKKVPGSYARKQVNLFTYLLLIVLLAILELEEDINDQTGITYASLEKASYLLVIIILILRFLMHIHSMRLLPSIGHFVVSTFMMGTNLLHFSVIFGTVVLIFSGVFHLVADKANCPLVKEDDFDEFPKSLLSTFMLAFGHGEHNVFKTSTSISLTYVLFVVIVSLLLMNLIIAVMSSTATRIMNEPWKNALWQMEWLDEAASVEYTFNVLVLLCRCSCCFQSCGHSSHRNAGFVVKEVDGKDKIYIEMFQCTSMD